MMLEVQLTRCKLHFQLSLTKFGMRNQLLRRRLFQMRTRTSDHRSIMSLQQYNSCLQSYLETTNEAHKQLETVKSTIVENLSNVRGRDKGLQERLSSLKSQALGEYPDAVKEIVGIEYLFKVEKTSDHGVVFDY
uniref:Uncharacterized protein n=1 Tax=Lotus japonicus TaxID=34305 RepID=I3SP16_LOTJA|nr:unknown [Lotus japonicus]